MMKIGILGTGIVGRSHAARLVQLGYEVYMGTRDVEKALSKSDGDAMGNPPLKSWLMQNPKVKLVTFSEAAKQGEMVINATKGEHSLDALRMAGEQNLNGKVLIDISNPLDFSKGMPPTLLISNNDSLGEQIQRTLPKVKVVKTLNTVNAILQAEPSKLAQGDHHIFMGGNDKDAKGEVVKLMNQYGWKNIIDLGDIKSSRGAEMMLIIWVNLLGTLQTPMFNFRVVTN
jgi:8-hydroxy-5-deazaflavin:NADPH oxidoreductase